MKTIAAATLSVLLATSSFVSSIQARPITGSIDFGGVVTFDSTSLANATRVNLWNSSFVLQDSGDFSSIAPGTNVTMAAPWIFNPSTNTPSLWSVDGFKFDLTSCVIVSQSATFLNITGVGTISPIGTGTGLRSHAGHLEFYRQRFQRPTAGYFRLSNTNGGRSRTRNPHITCSRRRRLDFFAPASLQDVIHPADQQIWQSRIFAANKNFPIRDSFVLEWTCP